MQSPGYRFKEINQTSSDAPADGLYSASNASQAGMARHVGEQSHQIDEMQVLLLVETHTMELVDYIQRKHEHLLKTIRGLTRKGLSAEGDRGSEMYVSMLQTPQGSIIDSFSRPSEASFATTSKSRSVHFSTPGGPAQRRDSTADDLVVKDERSPMPHVECIHNVHIDLDHLDHLASQQKEGARPSPSTCKPLRDDTLQPLRHGMFLEKEPSGSTGQDDNRATTVSSTSQATSADPVHKFPTLGTSVSQGTNLQSASVNAEHRCQASSSSHPEHKSADEEKRINFSMKGTVSDAFNPMVTEVRDTLRETMESIGALLQTSLDFVVNCSRRICCKKPLRYEGQQRLRHVIHSHKQHQTPYFDAFVGAVIICNAVVMTVQYQWQGYLTAVDLGLESGDGWPQAKLIFQIFEHLFAAFFLSELILRVCLNGCWYFMDWWSIFDLLLVVSSVLDLYILQPMGQGGGGNLTFMRFARIMKFVRVFRIVRVMKLFSSLRVLVRTIHSSSRALVWSMLLLGILISIYGMLMCQLLTDWLRDEKNDKQAREWVFKHYGSSTRAIYTVFEATLSGCWPNYARPLLDISDWYAILYVLYVTVVVFAVIRIITALFLKDTFQNAYEDADMMINEQLKKKTAYLEKLAQAFEAMDESGDGHITLDEFENMLENPSVKAYLGVLDLEVNESRTLFHLLDDGDGEITYAEFLSGVCRLKGQAKAVDLIVLQRDVTHLVDEIALLRNEISGLYEGSMSTIQGSTCNRSSDGKRHVYSRRKKALNFALLNQTAGGVSQVSFR